MTDQEFNKEILALGGTPLEFFDHPELMELFIPVFRNDFKLAETATLKQPIDPFECDITIFLGEEDDLSKGHEQDWKLHTSKTCEFHFFQGGHFFLHQELRGLIDVI